MSKTDRADFYGKEFDTDRPWHYRTATGWGDTRKLHKHLKRARSKANRRNSVPLTGMHGYGWGRDNYKNYND